MKFDLIQLFRVDKKIIELGTSSSLTCPRVCQWPFCGVQIKDGDTLQWHYEAHYAQELERLDKVSDT